MAAKEAAPRNRRINHPSLDERLDRGRTARDRTPPSSHAGWSPAADLAGTPVAGLGVQLCSDAHLPNFGVFASALRRLLFGAVRADGADAFDQSVTDFSERYADQNEQGYEEFVKAVRSGRLEAVEGV